MQLPGPVLGQAMDMRPAEEILAQAGQSGIPGQRGKQRQAMANPLSLPMAASGTATYVLLSASDTALGALLALAAGSWLGIRLASRWIERFPDRIHAGVYLLLLTVVLAVMVVMH